MLPNKSPAPNDGILPANKLYRIQTQGTQTKNQTVMLRIGDGSPINKLNL